MEDGMVSTLGALTGMAAGTMDQGTIIMAGIVVITVESISMGVGSYLSNQSILDLNQSRIKEEKKSIKNKLPEEKKELWQMLVEDGWPADLAEQMVMVAAKNKKLLFNEMLCRELGLKFFDSRNYKYSAWGMFIAYIVGGLVPLAAYFFFDWQRAFWISIGLTLFGLFLLGGVVAQYTKIRWYKNGMRMLLFGGLAMVCGLAAGFLTRNYWG